MSTLPQTAMLLGAGLGLRMRPITAQTPKPLVKVGGKSLIDWTLDQLAAAGVSRAVVNVHHLAPLMTAHLKTRTRPAIAISDETAQLLDTGGGIVKALPLLGAAPFYAFNCDAIIADGKTSSLARMARAWSDSIDALMLLHPRTTAHGFDGPGDFFLDGDVPHRRGTAPEAPYVFTGAQILHPRLFAGEAAVPFSMNTLWDRALAAGRLKAVVHDGDWFHVGTPEAVPATDALLARQGLTAVA